MQSIVEMSVDMERMYGVALSLQTVLEELRPGEIVPESKWFLAQQLSRQLTDSADFVRAKLLSASLEL